MSLGKKNADLSELEVTPRKGGKKTLKRAKAYLTDFSHLLKTVEKVRRPSDETLVTVELLLLLLREKFTGAKRALKSLTTDRPDSWR